MADLAAFARRHRIALSAGVTLLLVLLGAFAMEALTKAFTFADVRHAIHALSALRIASAVMLTAASYLALTFYDVLALRIIGRPLPWRTAALASFTSYTLSHNIGLSLLTGGSARYRIYTRAGLDGPDVARVIAVASATFWIGLLTVTGMALLARPGDLALPGAALPPALLHVLGAAAVALCAAWLWLCSRSQRTIRFWRVTLPLPTLGQAVAQIAIALLDTGAAAAALFVLVPGIAPGLLPAFILAYALGVAAAAVTHVPGGIGVFEAVVLAVVPADRTTAFAALVAYRIIYYLLPLAVAIAMLALREGARHHRWAARWLRDGRDIAGGIAPPLLAVATFLGGAMLLLSGSLPSLHARMGALAAIIPLPFMEASHIAASLVGTGLLLLAPGLYRRLDGAFVATRALLVAGALFSLVKGIDYEEALVCLSLAILLQWTRAAFYRRTALTQAPLSGPWLATLAAVLAGATWVGFFAYRHVPYDDSLWWSFTWKGDAPRFLRATLAAAVVLAGAGLWRWLGPARVAPEVPVDRAAVAAALAHADRTDAMLALVGDKRFLLAEDGRAMLMYQRRGASWIVMGDPIGDPAAWPALLWRIRDMADRAQGRLLLYQITPLVLDLALGMGLTIVKYGEEAMIDLATLDFDTPRLRSLRKAERAAARRGLTFRIVPAAAVPVLLGELAEISAEWMRIKGHAEKGFSLGHFAEDYICQFDVALAMNGDRIVAFANLWETENHGEASVDLMRHRADVPHGTMDFLFYHVLHWARSRGFARFSLGIAPLSGISGRRLAPPWARAAALVFRYGEQFYGFRGLRAYKEKFAPRWEPRYIAGPRGLALIQCLRDLSKLIAHAPAASRGGAPILTPSPTRPTAGPAVAPLSPANAPIGACPRLVA